MTDEEAFQAALDANPDEHTIRLVFADWLEERGDPRAEGYRALGVLRKRAIRRKLELLRFWIWLHGYAPEEELPEDWWRLFYKQAGSGMKPVQTRAACEGHIARAFSRLPAARRAELLGTFTPA